MDKYDLVLNIIEHPESYSTEQLESILSDKETREIYNLLCKADAAVEVGKEPDVEAEWVAFTRKHTLSPHRKVSAKAERQADFFAWFGSRAASIAAIIFTSLAALAAGIAITATISERNAEPQAEVHPTVSGTFTVGDSIAATADTVKVDLTPIMFEDETLENIMKAVADHYGVEVKFNTEEVASLHLYYKFDPALPLDDVIGQLNTFEQINITRTDRTLIID